MEENNRKSPKDRKSLPSWRELSKEQQCVLFSAAEQSMLIGVLANWEPEQDWLDLSVHTQSLAEAAKSLLLAGLTEVYEQHIGLSNAALLFQDDALAILAGPENWGHGNPEEDNPGAESTSCQTTFYSLVITDRGAEVLRTRGNDNLYEYLNH